MKLGRLTITAHWAPRPPRFEANTEYRCTGCGWWFEHIVGDHWKGAYYDEPDRICGQFPSPGRGRDLTWEQLCDEYADCYSHLAPR